MTQVCLSHDYSRTVTAGGRVILTCNHCQHRVDFTAARERHDRQQPPAPPPEAAQYDPTAGMIETPSGFAKFVAYDGVRGTVTVEVDWLYLAEYPAAECYLLAPVERRAVACG